ncbi:PAS domain S-box protein [Ktedonobacteria bacterium brp13]|nr:PAS domain S-box protein [Ktedonobacteria bacterium brp13]
MGQDTSRIYKTLAEQKKQQKNKINIPDGLASGDPLYAQIIAQTYDAIILCDLKQNIVALNASAEQLYGWQEYEVKGQNIQTLLQNSLFTENGLSHTLLQDKETWEGELFQARNDGTEIIVRCRLSWLHDQQGNRTAMLLITKDISSQRKLEQTIQQQIQCVNVAHDIGSYTWDIANDQTIILSPELSSLLNLPIGESISYEDFLFHVYPEDRMQLRDVVEHTLRTHNDYILEYRLIDAKQNIHWVWTQGRLIFDDDGFPTALLGFIIDMTNRHHIEEQLQEANRKISSILESITDGFMHLDLYGNVIYMNEQASILTHHPRASLIGRNLWEQVPNLVGSVIEEKIKLAQFTQQKLHYELFYEPWQQWFSVNLYPTISGISIYYSDVTEYKENEIALRSAQARFRQFFASNIIGMQVSNTAGVILDANDAFLKMIGYTQEDLEHHQLNWRQITLPEYIEVCEQEIEELYTKEVSRTYEKELYTKDGRRISVLVIGALLDRNTETFTTLIIDNTLQKRLAYQQETFMSIIGHELRTPLTAINGSIQLAQRRMQRFIENATPLSPEVEVLLNKQFKLLDQSLRQARVQNRLINDMLDISRLAVDKLELSLQPCNIIDIVQETVDDLRYTETDHTIKFKPPEQAEIKVIVDSDRIGQVISNYITNALKYSDPFEPITVTVELKENEVLVGVHDHGPGLSTEEQKHIWDRYYQVGKQQSDKSPDAQRRNVNLGLGLHICQVLITRHKGHVGVESIEGQGSSFWFTLPLAPHEEDR